MSIHPIKITIHIHEETNEQGRLTLTVKFDLHGTELTPENIEASPALRLARDLNQTLQHHPRNTNEKGYYHKC